MVPVIGALSLLAVWATHYLWEQGNAPEASVEVSVLLIALGFVAECLPFEGLPKQAAASVAFMPYAAALFLMPDARVVALVSLAQVLVQVWHRRPAVKGVFNVVQFGLATAASVLSFRWTSGLQAAPSLFDGGFATSLVSYSVPGAVAFTTLLVVNAGAVTGIVSVATAQPFWSMLFASLRVLPLLVPFQVLIAIYLAWLASNLGWLGTAGMVLPLIMVRQLSRTTIQLTKVTEELLDLMVAAIEARDPYTSGHSKRVASAAVKIAKAMRLKSEEVERVQVAALLHDVGKIHEEFARILAKEGRLNPEEWEIMKRHPVRSAELVGLVSSLKDVVPAVRHHHENWDGTGYPEGKREEEIPLASRIIMFADTLDAITTDRPYRRALDPEEARKEFIKFRGRQFDPRICDVVISAGVWEDLYRSVLASRNAVGPGSRPAPSAVA